MIPKRQEEIETSSKSLVFNEGNVIYFFDEMDAAAVVDAIRYIDHLEYNEKVDKIIFKLNSGGGNVYDGLALYDRLRNCRASITMIGSGLIASMAFIVYLAGDRRIATTNVRFLNHQTKFVVDGELNGVQIKIEEKETVHLENTCIDICAERTLLTPRIIKNHIKLGDKYIGIKEAVSMGIVHEVQEEVIKKEKI